MLAETKDQWCCSKELNPYTRLTPGANTALAGALPVQWPWCGHTKSCLEVSKIFKAWANGLLHLGVQREILAKKRLFRNFSYCYRQTKQARSLDKLSQLQTLRESQQADTFG